MQLVSYNDYPLDSTLHQASVALAAENSRLSSLPAAWDVSTGKTSTHKRRKSILKALILSEIWSGALIGRRVYHKTVSIRKTYSSLEEAFEFCWSLFEEHKTLSKIDQEKQNRTNLYLQPRTTGLIMQT